MSKDRLRFYLYATPALLAAALVVALIVPHDENTAQPARDFGGANAVVRNDLHGQNMAILPIPVAEVSRPLSGQAQLGEKIFHDPNLSADRQVSCASCHILAHGGDDGFKLSTGVGGAIGDVNAPTVFNSVYGFRQFWDGRAADLNEQVSGPLTNPVEMASSWDIAVLRIKENAAYVADFAREYKGEISARTISDALVRFESTLLTPNAPFDRHLNGDDSAINEDIREGYRRFTEYGCISCHQGINVGGNFFQKFGVVGDYFADRGNSTKADLGRFNVTGDEADRNVFKVPTLRNIAVTAPYFHDGSAETLDAAVTIMGRYQLGRDLSAEDRRYIIAFLESLTGEYRGERLQP
ncbi:MAG: cytochrome-c peroxidase [Azoarcus sp.]|jgi:cytochrome c peroxidase|nr:cytochrome-c peroxidase [Azoarcus sp.]